MLACFFSLLFVGALDFRVLVFRTFRKLGYPILGVLIIRIPLFRVLH